MIIITKANDVWDLSVFHGLKLISREIKRPPVPGAEDVDESVYMLAGTRADMPVPQILAFFPRGNREQAESQLFELVAAVANEEKMFDMRETTVNPDTQLLVDAGIMTMEVGEDGGDEDGDMLIKLGQPLLGDGPRVVRLRMGHDRPQTLMRIIGRKILNVEIGGDGTVALTPEGPYE